MAERRMFAKTIIDSDAFLDMPLSTQALYFHLSMRADDDGFINKPKTIMRICGCKDDDINILISKKFIIPFDTGIVVIKHWKIHNYIRNDRHIETKYKEEKETLSIDRNGAYTSSNNLLKYGIPSDNQVTTNGIPSDNQMDTQDRLGKDRLGKDRLGYVGTDVPSSVPCTSQHATKKRFQKPTLEQVQAYCVERCNSVDSQKFIDYYDSNGWRVGKNPMKDWKAAVRTWEKNGYSTSKKSEKQEMPKSENAAAYESFIENL